jgi:hypothetical protein
LVENLEGEKSIARPRCGWEDNIEINPKVIE